MKRIKIISILVISMILISSCKKTISGTDIDFIGTWYGNYTQLNINADGSGRYDFNNGFLTKHIDGKVKLKNNTIKFKALVFKKTYSINQRPTIENGETYMILDGEEFYKD